MMKKLLLLSTLMLVFSSASFGWGGKGHSAVAYVAEKHLTPKAKAALDIILGGKALHEVASDADIYRPVWVHDIGKEISNPSIFRFARWGKKFDWSLPSNIEPYPHSFTALEDFVPSREVFDTKDGQTIGLVNCVFYIDEYYRLLLAEHKTMDPEELSIKVRLLVHWLGDMHCPGHVSFSGKGWNVKNSTTAIVLRGKKTTMHKFWDDGIFSMGFLDKNAEAIADLADGFEKVRFSRKTTRGDVWEWATSASKISYETRKYDGMPITKGFNLPDGYPEEMTPVCLRQIRDGGYRLASVLNAIFK